ncbi:MAG: hypothetical protein M1113_05620 [Candidatus Thermoplasmatota archaeon]|nr:hypothetical protein [Candidatus Thermoplasmatota archaeon]
MSEKLYGVDRFYPGDFAPILIDVDSRKECLFFVLYQETISFIVSTAS